MLSETIFLQGVKLIETVTQKPFTDDQIQVYRMLLNNEVNDNNYIIGVQKLLTKRKYTNLPSVAEIIEFCNGLREDELDIKSAEAVAKIERALSDVGTYSTVAFDDPIIHLVIKAFGGWSKLGKMEKKDFKDKMKWEFPKLYKGYATNKNGEIPLKLNGIGDDKETVIYIGNKEKAQKWISAYKEKYQEIENRNKNLLS